MHIQGILEFRGDKSLSHRAAILAAIAKGRSTISNYLTAGDTLNTLRAMEMLGAEVTETDAAHFSIESPGIQNWQQPQEPIDVGNSGTGARLLLGLLAGCPGITATIDGDESLRKRPMKRIIAPLRELGAAVDSRDHLPLTITGKSLPSVIFREKIGSAQVKSGILLAGLASGSSVELIEEIPSRDHTENMLEFAGCPITIREKDGFRVIHLPASARDQIAPAEYKIWGDISSAAFFVVLGLLSDSGVLILRNVLLNPYRDRYLDILKKMGGNITILPQAKQCGESGGDIIVRPSKLTGMEISGDDIPAIIDELPILTIAGVFSSGTFRFRNAAELRVKESDRIHAIVDNLQRCGFPVTEFEDGLELTGNPDAVLEGSVEAFMDHRIIMSFEVAALRSAANAKKSGLVPYALEIQNSHWVETSFPDFYDKLKSVTHTLPAAPAPRFTGAVTLDGPAGSGKSSLARHFAARFGLTQLDSGALYRGYTRILLNEATRQKCSVEQVIADPAVRENLTNRPLRLVFDTNGLQSVIREAILPDAELRSPEVTSKIKPVADCLWIRELVNNALQEAASGRGILADGRDMGTVVFPEARLKFYVTADAATRAQRRVLEFQTKYPGITLEQVREQIETRDKEDTNREFGALRAAPDAIFIDTTTLSFDAAVQIIEDYFFLMCSSPEIGSNSAAKRNSK